MKKTKYYILILFIIFIDQLSKIIVSNNVNLNGTVTIINNFFNITYVKNMGAAFGMFNNKTYFIIGVSIFLFIYLLIELIKDKKEDKIIDLSFSLIIGGLLGNLYDRIFLGYVRDFLDFNIMGKGFAIFNLGDSFIVIGSILLLIGAYKEAKNENNNR